jgi:Apolipoprotein A1/A4/E domain
MANTTKKIVDPTEAALSAIQEALKVRDDESEPGKRPANAAGSLTADAPTPAAKALFETDEIGARSSNPNAFPANDDQQSIGQVLQLLQQRPARTSYLVASIFSSVWVVGCLALSWAYLSDLSTALGAGHSPVAMMIGLGAAALLPIVFFFGVAHMAWRAQELRLIAQSMAKVAVRLAEPEGIARDSVVTVGQAIRREVAAMGDGVERALARASELEALVHNEVAALERTYSDNEVRIRGLLQELTNQRDTLVGQAEQVRSAVSNVHIDLTQDLSTISDLVGQQVNEAAERITRSLAEKGEHITLALGQIGDNMIQQLSERGEDLLVRLETASDETANAITAAADQLTAGLNFKTDHVGEEFAQIARGLEDMMTSRLDQVTDGFSEKSLAIIDMMVGRSQELTDTIVNTSSQIADTIATSADAVNSTLRSSGESVILDLHMRGGDVAKQLEQAGARITDELITRGTEVTETLRESAEGVAEALHSRTATLTDTLRESADQVGRVVSTHSEQMRDLLSTRLTAFEQMLNHSGSELGEKITRDSSSLGNLITRHLAEFDRTVKTYGSELVERLGARTQDVSESMRSYVDSFDNRVTAKATEIASGLDQRLTQFQQTLDSRTETLTEALSARVLDIAKTLTEGGKEVVAAVDTRIADVTAVIDARGAKLASTISQCAAEVTNVLDTRGAQLTEAIGQRTSEIDKTLGTQALRVANTLDSRIGHLEELLVGRAQAVTHEIDVRSRAAADLLNGRLEELSEAIKTNSGNAELALSQLAAKTVDALGKSAAASVAATEALNRSAAEATVSLNRSAGALSNTIGQSAATANEAISNATATATQLIARTAAATTEAIGRSSGDAERALSGISTEVTRTASATTEAIGRSASEAERTLTGISADVARNVTGRAEEFTATVSRHVGEMARIIDEKSNGLLAALSGKGEAFAGEVSRITDQAVKSIEAKSFVFTQTMMDNSEEIARLINEASETATVAMTRTLGQLQEGAQGVSDTAKMTITRTLEDLHGATRSAIEQSKQAASATLTDMLETQGMLRSDTTGLFERLREANILLQEVLSGAHENMSSLERTMVTRVSEFVTAMNELNGKSDASTATMERHLGTFNAVTGKALRELGDLAGQFSTHGRSLAEAVELLEKSNRRAEDSISARRASVESLVTTLDARADDFGQRLQRFSKVLDESLDAAATRASEIAGVIAQTSNESVQTIEQQFDLVRTTSEEERRRTSETLNAVYQETVTQAHTMFHQSAERFTEIMQGMKQMAAEMQQELETTRAELRRGIFELPQETAESAAQMRRVIVDQIEALAELNRIVARHGRSLDTAEPARPETARPEPARREPEPAYSGAGRTPTRPSRSDITATAQTAMRGDITGAPPRPSTPPSSGNGRNGGWLSDLLTRASREEAPPIAPPAPRESARAEERPQRDNSDPLETLAVDVAGMIDNGAAAELWERYKRGERGLFNRRLYTAQGQRAFDEIRRKYRGDPEFRQTVEQYIHEFERLLEDVSRGDRGAAVARTYLTSDTGKVYTMLAHAAGRFDQ